MRRIVWPLLLALTIACASVQQTEFKTVSAAVAAVETARSAYQDLRAQCTANPAATTLCPKILAAHDKLSADYVRYQQAVKTLADANIAALQTGAAPDAGTKVAAAGAGLISVAQDFVTLTNSTLGGK
jgi:hypothetical protein